jgi:hypothetical protein
MNFEKYTSRDMDMKDQLKQEQLINEKAKVLSE